MPFIQIWIHLIFTTKYRAKIISNELKPLLLKHIKENAVKKGIYIDFMNCVADHIHILLSLGSKQNIADISQSIKGESSNWVNKEKLIKEKFEWQDEYIAISVHNKQINRLREYIKNQEEHHKVKSSTEEYDEFMKRR